MKLQKQLPEKELLLIVLECC